MAKFIKLNEVDNRLNVKYDKRNEVMNWGADNAYPSLIKALINTSVTSTQCLSINAKYVYGKGFNLPNANRLIVNKQGQTINNVLRIASKDFEEINNLFLHVNWNANYEITSVKVIPSTWVRIGKKDSEDYNGKYVVYNNWDKSKSKLIQKKEFNVIDRFNPNKKIIEAQVNAVGGWTNYKGQLLHINKDFTDTYSISNLDSVILDADAEYQSSIFTNNGFKKGFFNNKILVVKPFADDNERYAFKSTIEAMQGGDNTSSILLLEAENPSEDLKEQFLMENIDNNVDDKIFEYSDKKIADNIRKAFGVPSILIDNSDNSIFGQSGELLKTAMHQHWMNKEEERNIIEETFQLIFSYWHEKINVNDLIIKEIITSNKIDNVGESIN
ncbi:hypothetical protein [Galbibacter pacificus]|uniref:Phage portal protein n=1 Tax=Galbibacter pacificus TaxID=2996052 RepID=A0ABT6FRM6_9FLAO|nr:hypothetical protein [Galbibacter pacificus]MDG3581770.1 hypothetical protein [Galbibacter pacificus]MDG3585756.1 hypothetical protein [Galbibacter pacificus]